MEYSISLSAIGMRNYTTDKISKILLCKVLREVYGVNLKDAKTIADTICGGEPIVWDLPKVPANKTWNIKELGVKISPVAPGRMSLEDRLMQLTKAALKQGKPRLAERLLSVYNDLSILD